MKKTIIIFAIFLFPIVLHSQAASGETCIWQGGAGGDWETPGNWEAGTCNDSSGNASYPATNDVIVKFDGSEADNGDTNRTITINNNIALNQIIFSTGSNNQNWTFVGSDIFKTITFNGAKSQPVRMNNSNISITFNINVTVDRTSQSQMVLGDNGTRANNNITFGNGYTLTLSNKALKFKCNENTQSVVFNGSIAASSNAGDIIFDNYHGVTFGSTLLMPSFPASLLFQGSTVSGEPYGDLNAGAGITVNGPIQAEQVRLSTTDLTVSVTGSITTSGTGNNSLSTAGSGKFIVQTSKSNSGSIINNTDGDGYNLSLVRTVDGSSEWTLLGIPVTDQDVQTFIDNSTAAGLRTKEIGGATKSAIGYHVPATNTYDYFDSTGNTGTSFSNVKGYIVSPSASAGTIDVTIDGTAPDTNSLNYIRATFAAGDLANTNAAGGSAASNWNLIGNPYPAYVAINDNATGHDGDANNNGDYTDSGDNASLNFLAKNGGPLHDSYTYVYAWNGSSWDQYGLNSTDVKHIAPGEGFFIYMRGGGLNGATVEFNEQMLTTGTFRNFNAPVANGSPNEKNGMLKLKITDLESGDYDKTKLYFSDKRTRGLDPGYDGGKFFVKNSVYLYTRLLENDEGIDLGEQSIPYSDLKDIIIPLGIETKSSKIEISIIERDIDGLINIFLEDRLNNTIVEVDKKIKIDLNEEVKGHNRFFLHFTDGLIPELPTDRNLRIFKNSNSGVSIIGNPDDNYSAKVYDYSGRLIKEVNFNHKTKINDLDSKMKILRIESEEGLTIKKFKLN